MKFLQITIALFVLVNNVVALDDTPENRAKVAEEYLRVVSTQEMIASMAEKVALSVPAPSRELFKSLMTKYVDINVLKEAEKQALIKYFTADELQAMYDFNSTPQGKSILKKMASYTGDIMPVIQSQIVKAMQAALQEMKMARDDQ